MAASGSKSIVLIAMGANTAIAIAKFAASAWTGSSAMFSEGVHSLVDTANQGLILLGLARAKRPADKQHPFGYSKELYFWCFLVAIILFALGAGVSLYEGFNKVLHPHEMTSPYINYIVLIFAIIVEGYSTYKALAEFNRRYPNEGFVGGLKKSKDPALFAIVLEDCAAMIGLFTALIGVFVAHAFAIPMADGIASIVIGLVLAATAFFMSREVKALLIGEAASTNVQKGLRDLIEAETVGTGPIKVINEIRTMHLGPEDVLVTASVDFRDNETSKSVEATTARLERAIKDRFPEVRRLFLEVQSTEYHLEAIKREAAEHGVAVAKGVVEVSDDAEKALKS